MNLYVIHDVPNSTCQIIFGNSPLEALLDPYTKAFVNVDEILSYFIILTPEQVELNEMEEGEYIKIEDIDSANKRLLNRDWNEGDMWNIYPATTKLIFL